MDRKVVSRIKHSKESFLMGDRSVTALPITEEKSRKQFSDIRNNIEPHQPSNQDHPIIKEENRKS
ncbi:hypothetical protein EO94_10710 [Methanosarcina sp. 2.H.T.1A.3]|nr:hypothetical protein EO94_10710 [Methanosarcina sp. 2.H.T.1A.3]KKG24675.1 hypothetical protein EO97_13925 [Methanosarcina sp. 2.H.T.1A.15]